MEVKVFSRTSRSYDNASGIPFFQPPISTRAQLADIIKANGKSMAEFIANEPGDINMAGKTLFFLGGRNSLYSAAAQFGNKLMFFPSGVNAAAVRFPYDRKTATILCIFTGTAVSHVSGLPKSETWMYLGNFPTPVVPMNIFKKLIQTDAEIVQQFAKGVFG